MDAASLAERLKTDKELQAQLKAQGRESRGVRVRMPPFHQKIGRSRSSQDEDTSNETGCEKEGRTAMTLSLFLSDFDGFDAGLTSFVFAW